MLTASTLAAIGALPLAACSNSDGAATGTGTAETVGPTTEPLPAADAGSPTDVVESYSSPNDPFANGSASSAVSQTSDPASRTTTTKPSVSPSTESSSQTTTTTNDPTTSAPSKSTTTSSSKSATQTTTSKSPTKTTTTSNAPAPVDVALSEVPVGGAIVRTIRGRKVVISRPSSSTVRAFDARCTHAGCPVAPGGGQLDCHCHGSVFNQFTGAVINGPANAPLARMSATIHDGGISVG